MELLPYISTFAKYCLEYYNMEMNTTASGWICLLGRSHMHTDSVQLQFLLPYGFNYLVLEKTPCAYWTMDSGFEKWHTEISLMQKIRILDSISLILLWFNAGAPTTYRMALILYIDVYQYYMFSKQKNISLMFVYEVHVLILYVFPTEELYH